MIDFLQGLLLVAAILACCTIAGAVWLAAMGTRRYKLVEAWEKGHTAGLWDAHGDAHELWTANPYLAPHEQVHRG
jgi:hypothetical protein